jgi:hypothetical protein
MSVFIFVISVHIEFFFLFLIKTQKKKRRRRRRKKREYEQAIVADWPIEKRLSNIAAFFHWLLLSIGERLTTERKKKRESRERVTHTHSRKIIVREESKKSLRMLVCNFR